MTMLSNAMFVLLHVTSGTFNRSIEQAKRGLPGGSRRATRAGKLVGAGRNRLSPSLVAKLLVAKPLIAKDARWPIPARLSRSI
jgi:hypothetical protein